MKRLLVSSSLLAKSMVAGYTSKDGVRVSAHDSGRTATGQKTAKAKATGSAAPAKMANIGSEKYPMHVKSSQKLAAKRDDGSTHHVGGFQPPGAEIGRAHV